MTGRAAVVFGGVPVAPSQRLGARLSALDNPYVVAADRGATTALAFGYVPDLVVGDLDSIEASTVAELTRRNVQVEHYPRDKDLADGQLAMEKALGVEPDTLLLVGFLRGPRLDHEVANLMALTLLPPGSVLLDEDNECVLLRSGENREWDAEPGELVSLVPLGSDAHGIFTRGLRWALGGDTLYLGHTRGISNEPTAPRVGVSLDAGTLLLMRHFPRTGART
jgi:thiamine pyrophosphokinase